MYFQSIKIYKYIYFLDRLGNSVCNRWITGLCIRFKWDHLGFLYLYQEVSYVFLQFISERITIVILISTRNRLRQSRRLIDDVSEEEEEEEEEMIPKRSINNILPNTLYSNNKLSNI